MCDQIGKDQNVAKQQDHPRYAQGPGPKRDRNAGSTIHGGPETAFDGPPPLLHRPPSLADMVEKELSHSRHMADRANKLSELYDLLNRNPETARILELLRQVGI